MNQKKILSILYFLLVILLPLGVQSQDIKNKNNIILSCKQDNDLYITLKENKVACIRYNTPEEAIDNAVKGAATLLLADGYPAKTTTITAALFEKSRIKKLRLYVEFPSYLPGVEIGASRGTHWERAVISSDAFAPALEQLRILAIHDCRFVTMKVENPDIVMARVAGFDSALYGLPNETFPILCEMPKQKGDGDILVSTTKLSQFITARYGPEQEWKSIWKYVFTWLQPGKKVVDLKWTSSVRPSFSANEPLPKNVEQQVLKRGVEWYFNSKMIVSPPMIKEYNQQVNTPVLAPTQANATQFGPFGDRVGVKPDLNTPVGDGSLGVLEGFDARIFYDGTQPVRWWRRNDCNGEAAGAMSVAGLALKDQNYRKVGSNIADWLFFGSAMSSGDRSNPIHPAYGLIGWNDVPEYTGPKSMNGYEVYYDDDNARTALGVILSASVLKTDRYDERLSKNLLALMRITNKRGFMPDRLDQLVLEQNGWQKYFNDTLANYSPGMQSYVWAYFLWAYNQTGSDLFLKRAKNAITETMKTFPANNVWTNSTRSRFLLPLAWLVKIEDTPEHRKWLYEMAKSLNQEPNGAIRDEIPKVSWAAPPKSNQEYGTNESVLLQTNEDAVSDLLYTVNFAFLGLHEAAIITGEDYYKVAENKLADFLCRVQIRSEKHPELDGGWFRAFDIKKWQYWASSTDSGWGAWCIESGWSQSWITSVFALRQMNISLWDITRNSKIGEHFDKIQKQMLPDDVLK